MSALVDDEPEHVPPAHEPGTAPGDTLIPRLEQRIVELIDANDSDFGRFHTLDWVLCVLGALFVPYVAVIWFWP